MKPGKLTRLAIASVAILLVMACWSFSQETPSVAVAGDPAPRILDLALSDGGQVVGQVVDAQGTARPGVAVSLLSRTDELAVAKTDDRGYFSIRGLRAGVYQLAAEDVSGIYRVWTADTAPPSAGRAALLVTGDGPVRGQLGAGLAGVVAAATSPTAIIGAAAAGALTPIIIHNLDEKSRPSTP
jgi:hypothetical protein